MSGATIPYHLRQNKAIDRNLFMDLLARIGRWCNISSYTYIGFGGPYLEEFKLLHGTLRLAKMISIEMDANVVKRQKFNAPLSCIDFQNTTSGTFLNEYEFESPSVVWFDYTDPSAIGVQLSELELLSRKLQAGDVMRITVNASAAQLGSPKDAEDLKSYRLKRLQERLAIYCPGGLLPQHVVQSDFPSTLLMAIEQAAKMGLDTKPECVIEPLSCLTYADGQQMLTVTMIILKAVDREKFRQTTRLDHWPYGAENWDDIRSISVPQFSVKERLTIESMLPDENSPANIAAKLGYYIGDNAPDAEQLMKNFLGYYRQYPWYSKVVF